MDAIAEMKRLGGLWYVGTPYTRYHGGLEAAFREACRAGAVLLDAGISVYVPIAHTHPLAEFTSADHRDHEHWLAVDRPFMEAAVGMCVVEMPGWDESVGVGYEIAHFQTSGKPIVHLPWEEPERLSALERVSGIVRERGQTYAHPRHHFGSTVGCLNALGFRREEYDGTVRELTVADWPQAMIADKLARNRGKPHRDNRDDVIGYGDCWDQVEAAS